jgi:hypothetical protein
MAMTVYYVINDNVVDQFGHKYLYMDFDAFQQQLFNTRVLQQNSDFIFTVTETGEHKWIKNRTGSQFDDEFLMLVKLSSIEYT